MKKESLIKKTKGVTSSGAFRMFALAVLLLGLLANFAGADATSFCTTMTGPSVSVLGAGGPGFQGVLTTTVVILVIVLSIIVIVYVLGTAFNIAKLSRFARVEFGEFVVTVLVVLIFLGGFALAGSLHPSNLFAIGSPSGNINGVYYNDCYILANDGTGVLGNLIGMMISQQVISFFSTLKIGVTVAYWGLESVSPWAGLSLLPNSMYATLVTVGAGIFGVLIVMAAVIGIFYSIFPLFLFAGIILRSFPWTRAAGGAFLGLFVGFFLLFPLLLSLLIQAQTIGTPSASNLSGVTADFSSVTSCTASSASTNCLNLINDLFSGGTLGVLSQIYNFIGYVIGDTFYAILASVVSFIIAFDFTETVGDFLGAPSLSSSNVLKKLL